MAEQRPNLNLSELDALKTKPKRTDVERARDEIRAQENRVKLEKQANFKKSREVVTRAQGVGAAPVRDLMKGIDPSLELFEKTKPTTGDRDDEVSWYQGVSGFLSTWWNTMSNVSKKFHDAAMALISNTKG